MITSVTMASDIFTQSTFALPLWKILKTSANKCLFIIFNSSTIKTLILLCSKSSFQLFKNSIKMLWWGVFHSTSNKPTKPTMFTHVLSFPKFVQNKILFRLLLYLYSIGVKMHLTSSSWWVCTFFPCKFVTIASDFFSCCTYCLECELSLESTIR